MTAHSTVGSSPTLAAAHVRFTQAVTKGVLVLLQRGYSRERATATLLRQLEQSHQGPPTDQEIFQMMELYGLGMEDASQALIVSRAVTRVRSEREMSAIEAIDDLSSKLSVNLLESKVLSPTTAPVLRASPERRLSSPTMTAPLQSRTLSSVTTATQPQATKLAKNKGGKPKSSSSTKSCRKRSAPSSSAEDVVKALQPRPRADSVSEQVNAKVAKKARTDSDAAASVESCRNAPMVVRTKQRTVLQQDNDDSSNPAASPSRT